MQVLDLLYSNMRLVPFPLEQVHMICIYPCCDFDFLFCDDNDDVAGLGRQSESSSHCWSLLGPGFCQLPYPPPGFLSAHLKTVKLKMQATDIFTYNMTHCPGEENTATAFALLDTIVRLLREASLYQIICFSIQGGEGGTVY